MMLYFILGKSQFKIWLCCVEFHYFYRRLSAGAHPAEVLISSSSSSSQSLAT